MTGTLILLLACVLNAMAQLLARVCMAAATLARMLALSVAFLLALARTRTGLRAILVALLLRALLRALLAHAHAHTLSYVAAVVYTPGNAQPLLLAEGSINDLVFMRYHRQSGSVLPSPEWAPSVYFHDELWMLNARVDALRSLSVPGARLGNGTLGARSLQLAVGCEKVAGDASFWDLVYDGTEQICMHADATECEPGLPVHARLAKERWTRLGAHSHALEQRCLQWLERHLGARTNRPVVSVPLLSVVAYADGSGTRLRCTASGFSPRDVRLLWTRDGIPGPDYDFVEPRPSGDGSFQQWAELVVAAGLETHYVCVASHDSWKSSWRARWEEGKRRVATSARVAPLATIAEMLVALELMLILRERRLTLGALATMLACSMPNLLPQALRERAGF
ncbi:MC080R [Molluscum contagiosum virus subtype 1]|uniref:MC080R n=4 Tax=Molluscum contagiosum virus TaxID=10279 RepID=Q98247_MCV1|nr:MC080R [Molluscum contagiosum virus subtype 1]AZT86245.1 MC080R [Molluscum contagiosum virus]AAC55208.1 MC080R [Molluscum contagiosum virus subtype 1]AQY16829.1 MC080 [Molluscum contagiosum virus subtype 1]AQY17008.1 MC080 [Molluscum contagiosum virus subtype 1]AQY17187.1 MC080 [Molluscum contagiosum virus subtype 1]